MQLVRGTRLIENASIRRRYLNKLIDIVEEQGFNEITLPSIQFTDIYTEKAGNEILNQMYIFKDKKGRNLCLPPEGTATVQDWYNQFANGKKDVKVWYFQPFYRYERPQKGRYREFWQFGVEWLNPSNSKANTTLQNMSLNMSKIFTENIKLNQSVKRGLNYYTELGWEIECEELGSQKQVCGGGTYKEGVGFALGFDRLMLTI